MNKKIVIFYDGCIAIEITDLPEVYLPSDILNAYSEFSGLEMRKLTYALVDKIRYNELKIWKKINARRTSIISAN